MVRMFLLLALATSAACIPILFAPAYSMQVHSTIQTTMPSIRNVAIRSITLQAREEIQPPVGIPPRPNRDIGFATVFLRVENPKQEDATLIVKSVEIRNVSDGARQDFSQPAQAINLRPLENSELAFHLTNKTGYSGQDRVKAVVTYEVGEQLLVIESDPVEVNIYGIKSSK